MVVIMWRIKKPPLPPGSRSKLFRLERGARVPGFLSEKRTTEHSGARWSYFPGP
jgi:hypothetical protein